MSDNANHKWQQQQAQQPKSKHVISNSFLVLLEPNLNFSNFIIISFNQNNSILCAVWIYIWWCAGVRVLEFVWWILAICVLWILVSPSRSGASTTLQPTYPNADTYAILSGSVCSCCFAVCGHNMFTHTHTHTRTTYIYRHLPRTEKRRNNKNLCVLAVKWINGIYTTLLCFSYTVWTKQME